LSNKAPGHIDGSRSAQRDESKQFESDKKKSLIGFKKTAHEVQPDSPYRSGQLGALRTVGSFQATS